MDADVTRFLLRLAPFADRPPNATERLLDWAPGTRAATIEFGADFFAGWQPTTTGGDLLRFASGAYCADRAVLRDQRARVAVRQKCVLRDRGERRRRGGALGPLLLGGLWLAGGRALGLGSSHGSIQGPCQPP